MKINLLIIFAFITFMSHAQQIKSAKFGYAPINGLKMYYEIYGSGKPLVLIHGGGSTIQSNFEKIIPELSKTHMVIGVELQAHGRTNDRGTPSSFTQDADDVAALLKFLKIDKADILGFSNGGTTTMQIAIRHPEIVDRIILLSAGYKRDGYHSWLWDAMKNSSIDNMPPPLKEAFLKVNPDEKQFKIMFEHDSKRMQEFTGWGDEETKKIKSPALVVIAESDVVKPEHALEMAQIIPNSKVFILPGGHGGYFGDVSAGYENAALTSVFITIVEDFLKQ